LSLTVSNRILFALSLAGIGVALALTVSHTGNIDLPCTVTRGCEEVARHWSAHGFGIPFLSAIPTAAFGLLMYILLAALSFKRVVTDYVGDQRRISRIQWLIALSGVAVTAWLTYLEAYVIRAWCQWCLASAAIVALIFIVTSIEHFAERRIA
jgi:uncharacterized membrane protein